MEQKIELGQELENCAPIKEVGGMNGAMVENTLDVVVEMLRFYQNSEFRHPVNEKVYQYINEVIEVLDEIARDRVKISVEGANGN